MKKKTDKSKIAKIIDTINNHSLEITCELYIGTSDFYLIPTIYITKGYYLEFIFTIFNILIDIGFKINRNDN